MNEKRKDLGLEWLDWRRVENFAKRVELMNLRSDKKTLTWGSMLNHLHDYIIECRGDQVVVMRIGWREHLKSLSLE